MKICENCGKEHDGTYGSGRFCSSKCSKGFSTKAKRKEINENVKNTLIRKINGGDTFGYIRHKTLIEKMCPTCKNTFQPKKSTTIYCCVKCKTENKELKERQRLTCQKNCGGYREGSGRGKKSWYNSIIAGPVYLQSSWEVAYAKYLDINKINWKRNTQRFYYSDGIKFRYYIPDFYLIDEDTFIEIKGYKIELDTLKWKSVKNLKVLYKADLINLGVF